MKKIGIITDCTSDLTKEMYEKYNIEVLPLYVVMKGKTYQDGIDITTEEMYKLVDKYNELPKTSNVSPAKFEEYFKYYLEKYESIIYYGIGSDLSGTYQNAKIAASEFDEDKIFIGDSKNLSTGIGLLILKAAKYRDEGYSAKEIFEKVNELVPRVRTQFAINTLKYLHMGGRCSGVSKILGSALKLKPIIKVVDGKLEVSKKPIGYVRALRTMLDNAYEDLDNMDLDYVFLTHTVADDDAKYLKGELSKVIPSDCLIETNASGVIATHCGPRTIGILYLVKE